MALESGRGRWWSGRKGRAVSLASGIFYSGSVDNILNCFIDLTYPSTTDTTTSGVMDGHPVFAWTPQSFPSSEECVSLFLFYSRSVLTSYSLRSHLHFAIWA